MKKKEPEVLNRIADLLTEQYSEEIEIIENLRSCKEGFWISKAYLQFVSSDNPNEPDSKWQFEKNIVLEDKLEGTIILDILTENQIGGIEFLKYLE